MKRVRCETVTGERGERAKTHPSLRNSEAYGEPSLSDSVGRANKTMMMNRVKISRKSLSRACRCVRVTHAHAAAPCDRLVLRARVAKRGSLQFRLSIHRRENTYLSLRLPISTYAVRPSNQAGVTRRGFGFRLKTSSPTHAVAVPTGVRARRTSVLQQYDPPTLRDRGSRPGSRKRTDDGSPGNLRSANLNRKYREMKNVKLVLDVLLCVT